MQSQDTCVETQPLLHPLAQYEQAVRATSSSEAAHQTQQHHAVIIDPGDTQQPQPSQPSAPVAVSATQAPTAQAAERADETSTATATTRTIAGMNWNLDGLVSSLETLCSLYTWPGGERMRKRV